MHNIAIDSTPLEVDDVTPTGRFSFAQLLRWLGCAGVMLSAVVFLIQGFDDIAQSLRHWAYLGLMVVLSTVGVALKYVFADGKGARLLLGLAIAVIPIQFAQLGGMIHSLVSTVQPETLLAVMAYDALSWPLVLMAGAATLGLAALVALFGFRVLARPQAGWLTLMILGLSSFLLLPMREGFVAVLAFSALAGVTWMTDAKLAKQQALRTLEGRSARMILLLPLVIFAARASFYIGDLAGLIMVFGMLCACAIWMAHQYLKHQGLRELIIFFGSFGVCASWTLWAGLFLEMAEGVSGFAIFAVEGLALLLISLITRFGALYRLFGSLLFVAGSLTLLGTGWNLQVVGTVMMLGVVLAALGFFQQWRAPLLIGGLLAVSGIVPAISLALVDVQMGTWLGLALGGLTLVIAAAIVDRYGPYVKGQARRSWQEVKEWN